MRVPTLIATVLLTAGGAACSGMEYPPSVGVSASVAPAPNAAGVSRTVTIELQMAMPMDTASCRQRMLVHLADSTGVLIPATLSWEDGNRRMVLRPAEPLAPATRYFVHVRDSMMTAAGGMDGGMMGGGMTQPGMMNNGGGQHLMMQPPAGGIRMGDGMGWFFTTAE